MKGQVLAVLSPPEPYSSVVALNLAAWLGMRVRRRRVCFAEFRPSSSSGTYLQAYTPNFPELVERCPEFSSRELCGALVQQPAWNLLSLLGNDWSSSQPSPAAYTRALGMLADEFDSVVVSLTVDQVKVLAQAVQPQADYLLYCTSAAAVRVNDPQWLGWISPAAGHPRRGVCVAVEPFDSPLCLQLLQGWEYLGQLRTPRSWKQADSAPRLLAPLDYPEVNEDFGRVLAAAGFC